jgi:hypothetical protein
LRAASGQFVDPATQAAAPDRHLEKPGHPIGRGAYDVRCDRLDIPPPAQARRGELGLVEAADENGELTPLVGDRIQNEPFINTGQSYSLLAKVQI